MKNQSKGKEQRNVIKLLKEIHGKAATKTAQLHSVGIVILQKLLKRWFQRRKTEQTSSSACERWIRSLMINSGKRKKLIVSWLVQQARCWHMAMTMIIKVWWRLKKIDDGNKKSFFFRSFYSVRIIIIFIIHIISCVRLFFSLHYI